MSPVPMPAPAAIVLTNSAEFLPTANAHAAIDALVPASLADMAADRAERVVCLPDEPAWIDAARPDLRLRVLELVRHESRMTVQLQARAHDVSAPDGDNQRTPAVDTDSDSSLPIELRIEVLAGAELLVQRGTLTLSGRELHTGAWLRVPAAPDADDTITLSRDALLLIAIGPLAPDDGKWREVDSNDPERWLNGPVEGIEVLPLHGQSGANAMLVQWHSTAAFRPNLDPAGDEVFVLSGVLHDANGSFAAGSWIRNPVPAWQSWAGTPGTRICYRSGHFATVPDVDTIPAAPASDDACN